MATGNFGVFSPEEFYARYVRRAYDEFLSDPLDQYRVKIAVTQADIMAERMWHHFKDVTPDKVAKTQSPRAYRRFLVDKECADFQIIWDVHDGHKHVSLRDKNRQITSAAQTGIRERDGAFDPDVFSDVFDIGATEAVVILDDGTEKVVSDVLKNVIEMWERLLSTERMA